MEQDSKKVGAYSLDSLVSMGFGSRSFLYKEIATGRLAAKKCGKRTLVMAAALDEYCRNLPDAKFVARRPRSAGDGTKGNGPSRCSA